MQIEFYKIVAQIIPTIFLAMSLQSIFLLRGEKYDKSENFPRNIHITCFVASVFMLVLGEFVALRNIYENTSDANDLIIISLSMFIGVFWVVAEHILALFGQSKQMYFAGFILIGSLFNILFFISLFR